MKMMCQNFHISKMKLLFLSFLQKNIKFKGPVRSNWKILWHLWKSQKSQKTAGWPEISSVKKVLVNISNWHGFLMKTNKYKAIQPLFGMESQRSKRLLKQRLFSQPQI